MTELVNAAVSMTDHDVEAVRSPLLRVEELSKHFPVRRGVLRRSRRQIRAVDGVSFDLRVGETLSLVGESGCGKTTTGRLLVRLLEPTGGRILFQDRDVTAMSGSALRELRRNIQIMFQDPYASLSPRMTVHDIVAEPLRIQGRYRERGPERVRGLLGMVGLSAEYENRYPHEFSGGQRQRIGLARALALDPKLLVLDEPVSALDVSIRAQVINLMRQLQQRLGLAYVFISHDLSVVRHISHRVAVMYLGRIVEFGSRDDVFQAPQHPYTQALLSAIPVPDPTVRDARQRITLTGDLPSPSNPPSGCRFRTRCWKAQDICAQIEPELVPHARGSHVSACHFPDNVEHPTASRSGG